MSTGIILLLSLTGLVVVTALYKTQTLKPAMRWFWDLLKEGRWPPYR